MNVINVLKRVKRDIIKFLFKHLNNKFRIWMWRRMGVKIGERCRIHCFSLSPESYLIEIGDDVIITENVFLITHEGSICLIHHENPKLDLFGTIKIGNNSFIGMNSLILPNTTIGKNCIVGAGSIVRGNIPDNSVVIGNPARVIMSTDDYKRKIYANPVLAEYKVMSDEDKKRTLLERFDAKKILHSGKPID